MIKYYKLFDLLNKRDMKKSDLLDILSSKTIAKLSKGANLNTEVIDKICSHLKCQPGDIMEYVDKDMVDESIQTMYGALGGLFETLEKTTGKDSKTLWNEFLKHAPKKMKNDADFQDIQKYIEQFNTETEEEQKNT